MQGHIVYKNVLLQTHISHKLGIQMKNCEIPILAHGNSFPMRYSGGSRTSFRDHDAYLSWFMCGHTMYRHVLLQTSISHKPGR